MDSRDGAPSQWPQRSSLKSNTGAGLIGARNAEARGRAREIHETRQATWKALGMYSERPNSTSTRRPGDSSRAVGYGHCWVHEGGSS